jgi:[acyl-carrier-protein] S-malonyltransferase
MPPDKPPVGARVVGQIMKPDPARTSFLFPGQGSQSVGMGRELAAVEPLAAEVFQAGDRLLGYPLAELCWQGPAEELNQTANTQPAIFVHSMALLEVLKTRLPDFVPASVAGHSMGELSALAAAGSLSFDDGLRLVHQRGLAMKHAGDQSPGGMAAILGLELESIESACRQARQATGGVVNVANDNCPGQVVISGDRESLAGAMALCKQAGARKVIPLAVSIAAHSQLMVLAQERFNAALEASPIHPPKMPVYGNVGAAPLADSGQIRLDLQNQLTMRVRWTETIVRMVEAGTTTFIEVGPGSVLTGLVKRIDPGVDAFALDAPGGLDSLG